MVDEASGTVTSTINVGSEPLGVAADGGNVYVVNNGDNTVSVIDAATGTVTSTIDVGTSPSGVAAGDGNVYVSNNGDGTVSVIDEASGAVTDTIDVGTHPIGVTLDNSTVYVANSGDNTVSVIPVQLEPSTPVITNLPATATNGGTFTAAVATTGDGAVSVTSSTPAVCTVGADGLTVTYLSPGSCVLTAHVAPGAHYGGAAGDPQELTVNACTQTVTGTYKGALSTSGSLCVLGGTVAGAVTVKAGGLLTLRDATVRGAVLTNDATSVLACGSTVTSITTLSATSGPVDLGPWPTAAALTRSRGRRHHRRHRRHHPAGKHRDRAAHGHRKYRDRQHRGEHHCRTGDRRQQYVPRPGRHLGEHHPRRARLRRELARASRRRRAQHREPARDRAMRHAEITR